MLLFLNTNSHMHTAMTKAMTATTTRMMPVEVSSTAARPEDGRNGVEHGDGLLLAQAHVQQLVVKVSPVGMEGALSVQDAACERKYRVRKRNGKRKHRRTNVTMA